MKLKPAFHRLSVVSLAAILSLTAIGTAAEDGTSGTLPESFHQCEIVAANWSAPAPTPEAPSISTPVASPVAPSIATPDASPVAPSISLATPIASPAATSIASLEATPIASPDVTATQAPEVEDEALTEDLEIATHAILDCMSDTNLEVLLELTGEEFRGTWIGLGSNINDDDFALLLPMMASLPYALVNVGDARADGDSATATVRFTVGRQLITSEWTYQMVSIDGQNVWQVQRETILPTQVPENAAEMQIVINDGSFAINTTTVESGDIVIDLMNAGQMPHEVLIVRVPAGTDAGDFAAAPNGIPSGGTFVGQVTVPAGTQGSLVLTDVRAGTYTVVDLLPGESGLPNVSDGMITEFTVE